MRDAEETSDGGLGGLGLGGAWGAAGKVFFVRRGDGRVCADAPSPTRTRASGIHMYSSTCEPLAPASAPIALVRVMARRRGCPASCGGPWQMAGFRPWFERLAGASTRPPR